jgi:polyisoprenoid-binding protein YceI
MKIDFEVDSTWHLVHGTVRDLSGRVWLESASDPGSIRASLTIPVAALDTGRESRDDNMRDSLDATSFSAIHVEMPRISPACDFQRLAVGSACAYVTQGTITIRDRTLPIGLQGDVQRHPDGSLVVNGSANLD